MPLKLLKNCLIISVILSTVSAANSQPTNNISQTNFSPGLIPVAATIIPGMLIHGTGHCVGGDNKTGKKLLLAEGVGVGLIVLGGFILGLSGASEELSVPAIITAVSGVALFFESWLFDLYGSLGGVNGYPSFSPLFDLKLSYDYIDDPFFDYQNMISMEGSIHMDRFTITPFSTIAIDNDNYRIGLGLSYRIWRAENSSDSGQLIDSSFIDLVTKGYYHYYGSDYFKVGTGEISLKTRYDMIRFSKTLKGAFTEFDIGTGMGFYNYIIPDTVLDWELNGLLLVRFGVGFYLGNGSGEISAFYDHRRDDYPGGFSGFSGHMGLKATVFPINHLGITSEFLIGSAQIFKIGCVYRR